MGLAGQGWRWRAVNGAGRRGGIAGQQGYAMAALLVALAVMAILMSVAMPVWRQQARREKEAELVFRGEQYARAIALYRFKMQQQGQSGMVLPPTIDFLVEQRYLRKKYKDPVTNGDFVVIPAAGANPGQSMPGQSTPGQSTPGRSTPGPPQRGGQSMPGLTPPGIGGQRAGAGVPQGGAPLAIGGVMGVRSKSEETSLRSYRGQTRYDQWQFTFNNAPRPGGMAPPANTPDGRGGRNNPNAPGGSRGGGPFGSGSGGIGSPGGNRGGSSIPGGGGPRSGPTMPGRGGRGPGL